MLRDKRWTEPKKYGKISIRNKTLKKSYQKKKKISISTYNKIKKY